MFGLLLLVAVFGRTMLALVRDPAVRSLALGAATLLVIGTGFFYFTEDWSALDAMYFSVVSLTTVGYGDLTPTTTEARLFTMLYLLLGVGLLMGFINAAANLRLEQRAKHVAEAQQRKAQAEQEPAPPTTPSDAGFNQPRPPVTSAPAPPRTGEWRRTARAGSRTQRTFSRR
jgi:voltage-gated potassium channel